ncbi:hypothetical protein BDZ91DRAFT_658330 [Kalaharituber pfeilii]|nr:hypothetical protein BDZ91DRAFT_658330 [Kalaharituber pfeilii]
MQSTFGSLAIISLYTYVHIVLALQLPPPPVFLNSLMYQGSGCPPGSIQAFVPDDGSNVYFQYDAYLAENAGGPEHRAECEITIQLSYPQAPGWSYTVDSTTYRGYVRIDAGVRAEQESSYSFIGIPGQSNTKISFTDGPLDTDYKSTEKTFDPVWGSCDAEPSLMIQNEIRVTNEAWPLPGNGLFTIDIQTLVLDWNQC